MVVPSSFWRRVSRSVSASMRPLTNCAVMTSPGCTLGVVMAMALAPRFLGGGAASLDRSYNVISTRRTSASDSATAGSSFHFSTTYRLRRSKSACASIPRWRMLRTDERASRCR